MLAVQLLKRAGREFLRNLGWMLVAFGPLAAVLVFFAGVPLLGALPFVGIFVSVMAAIVTVLALWSGAHDDTLLRSNRGLSEDSGYYSGGTYYPGFLDSEGVGDGSGGGDGAGAGGDGGGGGW